MQASVDPVTRGVGGSVEGKEIALLVVIGAVVIGMIWFGWKWVTRGVENLPEKVTDAVTNAIVKTPDYLWSAGEKTVNSFDKSLAAKQEEAAPGFSSYVDSLGVMRWPVEVGTGLLPSAVISAEVQAGSEFAQQLQQNNDTERFNELNPASKSLVILGQAITMPLGLNPYEAGVTVRQSIGKLFGGG